MLRTGLCRTCATSLCCARDKGNSIQAKYISLAVWLAKSLLGKASNKHPQTNAYSLAGQLKSKPTTPQKCKGEKENLLLWVAELIYSIFQPTNSFGNRQAWLQGMHVLLSSSVRSNKGSKQRDQAEFQGTNSMLQKNVWNYILIWVKAPNCRSRQWETLFALLGATLWMSTCAPTHASSWLVLVEESKRWKKEGQGKGPHLTFFISFLF